MGTQKIMAEIKGTQPCGDNLLKDFTMTLKKRDGAISLCKRVVRFLGFGDDDNFSLATRVKM